MPNDIVLVLDDYHVIDAPDINDGMAFLLEHLPPQVHLVIATRADPALPLARLRARGELVEIRAADLRFTPDEAAAYLNEVMGLDLTAQDVAALEGRTEGWIAALQLAALSMQGRDDVAGFIAGFAGDDRYIVDYLVEEVLQRQPERVRSFLLQTSILGRLSGPLCDAVTGHDGRQGDARGARPREPVPRPARRPAPVVSLPPPLRRRAAGAPPRRAARAGARSSTGGRASGTRSTANGPRRSATRWRPRTSSGRRTWSSWRSRRRAGVDRRPRCAHWLEALPDELIRVRPVLSNAYAGSLLVRGEVEGVEERLRDAERWLGTTDEAASAGATPRERARWSSSTRRRSADCRARSPSTGPARP